MLCCEVLTVVRAEVLIVRLALAAVLCDVRAACCADLAARWELRAV
ncbi:MAG: hypothetical protein Q4C01_07385 [Clostridia bacterium]|nr:hypothetical protein [Clostridia bacterium]